MDFYEENMIKKEKLECEEEKNKTNKKRRRWQKWNQRMYYY